VKKGAIGAGILLFAGVGLVYWRAMAPRVEAVHPEAEAVPANLLRFYVDFSQPMAGDDVFEHVRLLDAAGRPIPDAFREIELWSRDNRRLMLYVHPGRVKTGLALGERFGPVLEEGRSYTLDVRPGMKSQSGRPVRERVARVLHVDPPDRRTPDLARWTLSPCPDRLEIVCDKWLDHAGLEDFVRVEGVKGRCRVLGPRVTFTPERRFVPGEYRLTVDARLEDLAGNNFIKPFETPGGSTPLPSERPATLVRPFRVPARE
jgi:hypothetical protein